MFGRNKPIVKEIKLKKDYAFMYEGCLISTQHALYFFLEKNGSELHALKFDFCTYRFGGPNDEARNQHPLREYGLGYYGFFEVENSTWPDEYNNVRWKEGNKLNVLRIERHFVVCIKDVMLEVLGNSYTEISLSAQDALALMQTEFEYLQV